jgi:hypothetical protein
MSDAEFDWSYAACRKMDSLARKAYRKATGRSLPSGPVNADAEQVDVELLPLEFIDGNLDDYSGRCGTTAGYHWHRRRKEKQCEACLAAHREKRREQRRKEKQRAS